MNRKILYLSIAVLVCILFSCQNGQTGKTSADGKVILTKTTLLDKIKGGWAGQVIGCTYGGPTEFKWNGTMIDDNVPIPWDEDRMHWYFQNSPGLYDDVYMDLTFVEIFEKYGLDAPDSLHALAFARAEYQLWHANQAARYNILNGIMPPASGYWKNNPHADDIDFQIEADFAGLMSPGMVNTAADIGNRIGHIMNYGDGVYGGIYVASMYALAFVNDNIEVVVTEALKSIPAESEFYRCISDIIKWYRLNPDDWKAAWFEAQKKWTFEKGCPDGVFLPSDIDAKINAAYIVIGLLYGKGDFSATIDISTRCGFDSDCNPASAAGILGTMKGYSGIPEFWKQGIDKVENMNFRYTDMSLNKVYEIGFRHALEMIGKNGGLVEKDTVTISYQVPKSIPPEVAFEGLFPTLRKKIGSPLSVENPEVSFGIEGGGFVITGRASKELSLRDDVLEAEVFLDGQLLETVKMPTQFLKRRLEVAWNYELKEGNHNITLKAKKIPAGYRIDLGDILLYSTVNPGKRVLY